MTDYNIISVLNEEHKVYLVRSFATGKIYVQKTLDVYNINVYERLYNNPLVGIPRIISYYEQDRQLFVIEEYISGTSLQEKIENADLSPADIKNYMLMLCNILESLHSMNPAIIHRDIKPSNIIITNYNYVILLDFNAAKQFSPDSTADTILLGTPGYAAPEQYGFGSSSPQTDIYSLGMVLNEMAESLPASTPDFFGTIIKKCTEMSPSLRYTSVSKLKEALMSVKIPYVDTEAYTSTSSRDATRLIPPGFRSKKPWKMLLAAFVYLLIAALCLTLQIENTYGGALWLERIFSFFILLTPIFCGFDYGHVQNIFPLCRSKNRFLHYLGIVLLDVIIILVLFILLFVLESVFFPMPTR